MADETAADSLTIDLEPFRQRKASRRLDGDSMSARWLQAEADLGTLLALVERLHERLQWWEQKRAEGWIPAANPATDDSGE